MIAPNQMILLRSIMIAMRSQLDAMIDLLAAEMGKEGGELRKAKNTKAETIDVTDTALPLAFGRPRS